MSDEKKQIKEENKPVFQQDTLFDLQTQELEEVKELDKSQILNKELENSQADKQKIDEIEQTVSNHSSRKKRILNWCFFALNIVVVAGILVYQLCTGNVVAPTGLKIYAVPFLCMLLLFGVNIFSDTLVVSYLLKRNTGKWRFGLAYKTNTIGRYYDAVTPLSTGGQPFQITYLKGRDVPLHTAMSIPLTKMIFQQICWFVVSFVCLIVAFSSSKYNSLASIASVIGFILSAIVLGVVILFSVSKKLGKKLVVVVLKLLKKLKIVKNYEKMYDKFTKTIEDYQSVMRRLAKSPMDFFVMFTLYLIRVFALYSLPYFIYSIFSGFDSNLYIQFFVMSVMIDLASSFFPLPGGTGMSELTFTAMFSAYFVGGTLFWALLTWRFFSYYFYLLQGLAVISYDIFYGNRKHKWQIRRDMLAQESSIFKQEQINKFRAERNKRRAKQNRTRKKSAN